MTSAAVIFNVLPYDEHDVQFVFNHHDSDFQTADPHVQKPAHSPSSLDRLSHTLIMSHRWSGVSIHMISKFQERVETRRGRFMQNKIATGDSNETNFTSVNLSAGLSLTKYSILLLFISLSASPHLLLPPLFLLALLFQEMPDKNHLRKDNYIMHPSFTSFFFASIIINIWFCFFALPLLLISQTTETAAESWWRRFLCAAFGRKDELQHL